MKTEIKSSIIAGIAFGVLYGLSTAYITARILNISATTAGISVGIASGIMFGVGIFLFVTSKTVKEQTQIDTNGQSIIFSGPANHFMGIEGVGGKLYLFSDRLEFKSHNFNIQNHHLVISLKEIKEVSFYNPVWFIRTGMNITMINGKVERFVVPSRKLWQEKILNAKAV